VLPGEEVGEYLLLSESERSLSDLEIDSNNERDNCAFLDVVVMGVTHEDGNIIQDCLGRHEKL
jgi:hypothetical protein